MRSKSVLSLVASFTLGALVTAKARKRPPAENVVRLSVPRARGSRIDVYHASGSAARNLQEGASHASFN